VIPAAQISASSKTADSEINNARLEAADITYGWSPDPTDAEPYLLVSLNVQTVIYQIATQVCFFLLYGSLASPSLQIASTFSETEVKK